MNYLFIRKNNLRDKVIFNDDSSGDAFTDLLFNALLGFAFMFFISFALIQKPLEDGNIESKAEFIISVEWDLSLIHI